jgi:anti-sigma factor RsiW
MNSPNDTTLDGSALSDQLIAYLDGELDADSRHRIEEQLSMSSQLRQRLKELQQSWDLLDDLPRDQVDDSFAKSTVEMVAIRAESEVDEHARHAGKWKLIGWGLAFACAGAAAATGFWLTFFQLAEPNRQVVRDLPILQHLDAYQSAGSVGFLRELEKEGLFGKDETDAQ